MLNRSDPSTPQQESVDDDFNIDDLLALENKLRDAGHVEKECTQKEVVHAIRYTLNHQISRNENYAALLAFLVFYGLYLLVVFHSNGSPSDSFHVEQSLKENILMSSISKDLTWRDSHDFYKWVNSKVLDLFEEPNCGNGICESPTEIPQWAHLGCAGDCGYHKNTTNVYLEVKIDFAETELVEGEWLAVEWQICSLHTHQGLCVYTEPEHLYHPGRQFQHELPVDTEVKLKPEIFSPECNVALTRSAK